MHYTNTLIALIHAHGLRPVINEVAQAALDLQQSGKGVKDEYGDLMDESDVQTAIANLQDDLY